MPWYAELKRLPAGYDNPVQTVWYVGKIYRVAAKGEDSAVIYTPDYSQKQWYMAKDMARRIFNRPFWKEGE